MSLYHTYRPQTFADIVEQAAIVTTLMSQVKLNKPAHAYLFSGPRGVGKTTTARVLAKALNCENRAADAAEPCNTCSSCKEITDGRALDVIEIDAASHTGVDNVRQNIIENAQFQPTRAKNKIFIIDEVHMLSTAAFNALLKTIEEPPAHVVFMLATTETQKIPATILSRCQRFTFKKVPADVLATYLGSIATKENMVIDSIVLERIAYKSDGCVRDGLSLLDQLAALGRATITAEDASLILPIPNREAEITFLEAVTSSNVAAALEHLHAVADTGMSLTSFADGVLELARTCLLVKADPKSAERELVQLAGFAERLKIISERLTLTSSVQLLDALVARVREVKGANLPTLPLELLAINWAARNETPIQSNQTASQSPVVEKKIITSPPPTIQPAAIAQPVAVPAVETPNTVTNAEASAGDTQIEIPATTPASINSDAPNIPQPTSDTEKSPSQSFTKSDVEKIWPQFLNQIDAQFHSLSFLLKMAKLVSVEAPVVTVSVPYSFHQEKLSEKLSQHNIEVILSPLLQGKTVRFIAQLDPSSITTNTPSPELQNLASAFGGHVV